ncbi:GFA family protein [Rhodobacteraceae bacterium NNCM2]|nr:GFA family protein [Coraliihabitans acroporae]
MSEITGSCLCGGISYAVSGPFTRVLNCHCSMCRKAHAAAFRTRMSVRSDRFQWLSGVAMLPRYESSPGRFRCFCKCCGSHLATVFEPDGGEVGLPLGALDADPGVRPEAHVFVTDAARWHAISDTLPQWPGFPGKTPNPKGVSK